MFLAARAVVSAMSVVLQRVDGYLVEGRVDLLPEYLIRNRVPDISPVNLVIHISY